jgi:hypothetical protein
MAAYEQNPWNMTPAEEPSALSLGADANGVFALADEDVDGYGNDISPIKDGTQPYAAMMARTMEAALAASRMVPSLRVTIRFNAGAPVVDSFRSTRDTLKIEDIDLIDGGTGITTVRVVDTSLPPKRGEPSAAVHEGTKPTFKVEHYSASGWRGALVTTWDNGSAANLLFTVEIW